MRVIDQPTSVLAIFFLSVLYLKIYPFDPLFLKAVLSSLLTQSYPVIGHTVELIMAPQIQVPCNFGREYINVREHCNLKLKLKNGNDYLVNSIIMSYNSPEIKRLTTEHHQTSLYLDDFEEDAVYCFVDALYTGELEQIGRSIFTDVYKMVRVFKVSWLLSRCRDFFTNLVGCREVISAETNDAVYQEVKNLFDIAMIIYTQNYLDKEQIFVDVFMKSFTEKDDKLEFATRFFGGIDLNEMPRYLTEQTITLVGDETGLLVDGLVTSLRNHNLHNLSNYEVRRLLEKCADVSFHQNNHVAYKYNELFDILDEIDTLTEDDLRFLNRIKRIWIKRASGFISSYSNVMKVKQPTLTISKENDDSNADSLTNKHVASLKISTEVREADDLGPTSSSAKAQEDEHNEEDTLGSSNSSYYSGEEDESSWFAL